METTASARESIVRKHIESELRHEFEETIGSAVVVREPVGVIGMISDQKRGTISTVAGDTKNTGGLASGIKRSTP